MFGVEEYCSWGTGHAVCLWTTPTAATDTTAGRLPPGRLGRRGRRDPGERVAQTYAGVSPSWLLDWLDVDRGGDGRQQRAGVGVSWGLEDLLGRRELDNLTQIHDRDAGAHLPDHGQVVGDEDVGEANPLLQIAKEVEDLGPHGHVERRDRFVEHNQSGIVGDGAGDGDPLSLTAGELVRKLQCGARIESNEREQLRDPRLASRRDRDIRGR